jgi:hypothetical protein
LSRILKKNFDLLRRNGEWEIFMTCLKEKQTFVEED